LLERNGIHARLVEPHTERFYELRVEQSIPKQIVTLASQNGVNLVERNIHGGIVYEVFVPGGKLDGIIKAKLSQLGKFKEAKGRDLELVERTTEKYFELTRNGQALPEHEYFQIVKEIGLMPNNVRDLRKFKEKPAAKKS